MQEKEIIESVFQTKTPYRKELNIPKDIKFGFEIEAGVDSKTKTDMAKQFHNLDWKVHSECSIRTSDSIELCSPVFDNTKSTWKYLKKISLLLIDRKADFSEASFQVNVDNVLSDKSLMDLFKLIAAYEDVIYSFSKGNDAYLRSVVCHFASSIGHLVYNSMHKYDEYSGINKLYSNKRYMINIKKNDIIEFRTPNSTYNALLWQNYVNTFINMILTVKYKKLDFDKIDSYIEKFKNPYYVSYSYNNLYLDKALEFSNIVFDNDIDKLYFMKQYICSLPKREVKKYINKMEDNYGRYYFKLN